MTTPDAIPLSSFLTFGDLLRYLRRRAHLTQRQLSIVVGYSEAQINRLEQNLRLPNPTVVTTCLAPALGLVDQPAAQQRLLELAAQSRGQAPTQPTKPFSVPVQEPVSPTHPPSNLPYRLTSFIGREGAMSQLVAMLEPEANEPHLGQWTGTRLITLTGTGGVGKTSLALEVAAGLLDSYGDGIWLVELSAIADPDLLAKRITALFRLPDQPGRSHLEALIAYLQPKQLLLILDNCEHLILACAQLVAALLQACPRLVILAVSREPLAIAGEVEWRVAPLTTPVLTATTPQTAAAVTDFEAIRLFVARLRTTRPNFFLTDQNASFVAQICTQLDGIPLGIELAAARCSSMTLAEIAQRLDQRLSLLTGGLRTAEPRHRTLRNAIAWSYDLLTEAEQQVFCRLGVFAGGCTLATAEALINESPVALGVADAIHSLVSKSLLIQQPGVNGESRYTMLDTLREFARERLTLTGELSLWRKRHAHTCLHVAVEADPHLRRAEQIEWLQRLDAEHENMRAALTWSLSAEGDALIGLRLGNALSWFWHHRGHYSEGSRWLDALLARSDEKTPASLRGWALYHNSLLAVGLDDFVRGCRFGEAALVYAKEHEDNRLFVLLTSPLNTHLQCLCQLAASRQLVAEAHQRAASLDDEWACLHLETCYPLSIPDKGAYEADRNQILTAARKLGDRSLLTSPLLDLSSLALQRGELARAKALVDEGVLLTQQLGDRRTEVFLLQHQAQILWMQGDYPQCLAVLQESLRLAEETSTPGMVSMVYQNLGATLQKLGDFAATGRSFQAALRLLSGLQHRMAVGGALLLLAEALESSPLPQPALLAMTLVGAATAQQGIIISTIDDLCGLDLSIDLGLPAFTQQVTARSQEPGFAAAWEAGRAMSYEEAIEYGLAIAERLAEVHTK